MPRGTCQGEDESYETKCERSDAKNEAVRISRFPSDLRALTSNFGPSPNLFRSIQIASDSLHGRFLRSEGIMSSLARFPYRLMVESGETSKWEVQETGKAPEPPNTKNPGLGTSNIRSFRPPNITASIPQISSNSRTRFPLQPRSCQPSSLTNNPTLYFHRPPIWLVGP